MPSTSNLGTFSILASILGSAVGNLLNPLPVTASSGAIKWQPVLDWDKDVCYNTAAMDASGNFNEGTDMRLGTCRQADRLYHSNVYVRERCNHSWCVYLYAYYAEQDLGPYDGHRHDWEHAQVWTRDDTIQDVRWSAHGDYSSKWAGHSDVRYEGNHFKLVMHQGGVKNASLRLAESKDDNIENDLGEWEAAWLVDLDRIDGGLRAGLMRHDFGSAHLDLADGRFEEQINKYMPDAARESGFQAWV